MSGSRDVIYEFFVDGEWIRTTEFAKRLGVNTSQITSWRRSRNFEKHIGYTPEMRIMAKTVKPPKPKRKPGRPRIHKRPENDIEYANPILNSKPKHHIIYACDMPYKYGIDYGRGHSKEEAVKDFLHSRKDSELNYKVEFVSQDYKTALNYMIYKMREEGINE